MSIKKSNVQPVHERGPLSREEFFNDFVKPGQAVVMRGGADHWNATKRWTFEYIGSLRPELPVVLEVGNCMQSAGQIAHMTLPQYTDLVTSRGGIIRDGEAPAYLSIFHLFDEIPELRADVDFSILSDGMIFSKLVGWLGPVGTISGYHADWAHNLFCQVVGRKRFKLVPPSNDRFMYPSNRYDRYSNQSHIDLENWDAEKYPLYAQAPVVTVEIEPGDMLYFPPLWWHHVESLDASISVNCFSYRNIATAGKAAVVDRVRRLFASKSRENNVSAGRDPVST
jgi:hypothetical protein